MLWVIGSSPYGAVEAIFTEVKQPCSVTPRLVRRPVRRSVSRVISTLSVIVPFGKSFREMFYAKFNMCKPVSVKYSRFWLVVPRRFPFVVDKRNANINQNIPPFCY